MQYIQLIVSVVSLVSWADPEGVTGVRTPLENHKNIGFLCNTGTDLLKKHKASMPALNVGPLSARQRKAI